MFMSACSTRVDFPGRRPSRRAALFCVALLALCAMTGCGETNARDLALDRDKGIESLETFLTSWTAGRSASELRERDPAIVGGDVAWETGLRLARHRIVHVGDDGTNLHVRTELDLYQDPTQVSRIEVVYVVGTSPVITIQRQ